MSECPQSPQQKTIFLALPTYNGWLRWEAALYGVRMGSRQHRLIPCPSVNSLLANGFNKCWCEALNRSPRPDYFAMLHADIGPAPCWLDVLIAELERVGADLISAVVPFKSMDGLTSTGMDTRPEHMRRLTVAELMQLPETFDGADLRVLWDVPAQLHLDNDRAFPTTFLVNSGCWVCRFADATWVEQVWFEIQDHIVQRDGKFVAHVAPEDWNLSRKLAHLGCSVYATRKVPLEHHGEWGFSNDHAWGEMQRDEGKAEVQAK